MPPAQSSQAHGQSFPALYPRYCPEGLPEVPAIEGFCHPDWECVRARFAENFRENLERGGAVCVYHQGRKVVDLWAGEKYPGIPWTSDTLTCSFSMGKGLAALGLALLRSRGHLNYDEKVSTYWPEFGCNGKDAVTVRELLGHQTGACNVEEKLTEEILRNPSQLAAALAKTKMEFGPSDGQNGYMALTIGWYMDILCRKVDPQQRGIDQLLREEITSKLGLASEVYCGLPSPSELDRDRIASLNCFSTFDLVLRGKFSSEFVWNMAFTPSSYAARAFKNPNFLGKLKSYATERVRTLCIPGANFITSARGAAGLYDAILSGTGSVGFKPETLRVLSEPAEERFDVVVRQPTAFSLGFGKPASPASSCFGSSNKCFGAYGTGGQFAFADPDAELAYAYCTNRLGTHLCDPRDLALRQAVYSNLARLGHPSREQPPDKTLEKHLKAGTAKETTCFDWFLRLFGGFFLWLG